MVMFLLFREWKGCRLTAVDAEFIAHAREDIPMLVDEVRKWQQAVHNSGLTLIQREDGEYFVANVVREHPSYVGRLILDDEDK